MYSPYQYYYYKTLQYHKTFLVEKNFIVNRILA